MLHLNQLFGHYDAIVTFLKSIVIPLLPNNYKIVSNAINQGCQIRGLLGATLFI